MTAASDKHKNHNGNSKHKDAWDSKVGQQKSVIVFID